MPKKIRLILVFVLAVLFSGAFGEDKYLDVILRDFNSNYAGFEEFDTDKGTNGQCAGSNPDKKNSFATTANGICYSGNNYIPCNEGGTQLQYGHTDNCDNWATSNGYPKRPENNKCRWFCNGPDQKGFNCSSWRNDVYVTKGIVQEDLYYDKANCSQEDIMGKDGDPDYLRYRYCARPQRGNGACYGDGVESWFTDGEHTRVYRDMMTLKQVGNVYEINHDYNTYVNWNDEGEDNGYFPLDRFENTPDFYGRSSFNSQSIRVWCPEGGNQDPAPDPTVCSEWRSAGGPRNNLNAARSVAQRNGVMKRLHNYSFSMAGSGEFKYVEGSNDVFEFIGDDDMWIFIDGKLVADLGGNHLAAPAKINVTEYGRNRWENNSKHAINFYYLDRQTDGSNMKLRMALTDLSDPRFGAPKIKKAETTQKQDGSSSTIIYVSNKLDEESIKQFLGTNEFPIVINKAGGNTLYGFKIESISNPENMGSEGYAYIITGKVCRSKTECGGTLIISEGDSLSFNVMFDNLRDGGYVVFDGLALPSDNWYIKSSGNKIPATVKAWAINTTSMPPIVFKPEITDEDVRKPDFNVDIWFAGDPNGGKGNNGGAFSSGGGDLPGFGNAGGTFPKITQIWDNSQNKLVELPNGSGNKTVHGFGTKGTTIPPNRAGELILTAYPNAGSKVNGIPYSEWDTTSAYQKLFGMPPKPVGDNLYGIADPTMQQPSGGYMFVKNGFKNESSVGGIQVAPTRCIADKDELGVDGSAPRINCLNFSLRAKQPFQLAVTVYDQLGNFVTQYRETIDEKEFRSVVQGPTFIESKPPESSESYVYPIIDKCRYPNGPEDFGKKEIITTNGFVKVNVNIYPFSKDGRRFGNGVYILKIDRVDLPYEGCMNSAGNAVSIKEEFVRYHADAKFGWMRTK
jgi:fibro-slime domain-containing protein